MIVYRSSDAKIRGGDSTNRTRGILYANLFVFPCVVVFEDSWRLAIDSTTVCCIPVARKITLRFARHTHNTDNERQCESPS